MCRLDDAAGLNARYAWQHDQNQDAAKAVGIAFASVFFVASL